MLSGSSKVSVLLPEIRSNIVMAVPGAQNAQDVAGVPGRLTEVFGRITAAAYPAWGASRFTSRILLTIMKYDPGRLAAMEIRYTSELVDLIGNDRISVSHLKVAEGKTLDDAFKESANESGLPTVFYTEGGFAREGAIIVTGKDAVSVAKIVLRIADLVNP
jgi:predicted fused transcriptional regulator/phosphomethylpyrimidine kinase